MVHLLVALQLSAPLSVRDFLPEMINLATLAERSSVAYTMQQSSSYDRASVSASDSKTWFANGDAGKFLREEDVSGRRERVMADLKGPGVVMRIWSANPAGRVRFYFDGSDRPLINEKLQDLLGGKVAGLGSPFGYTASRGWNLYFPIPYEKSLKITVDDTDNNESKFLYYHVNYRTYPASTAIESYHPSRLPSTLIQQVAAKLDKSETQAPPSSQTAKQTVILEPGASRPLVDRNGTGAIYELTFYPQDADEPGRPFNDPARLHNKLRGVILQATFDGRNCVDVPMADFFSCAGGAKAYQTLPLQVDSDGTMTCRFVMPFKQRAALALLNLGQAAVTLDTSVTFGSYKFTDRTMHFMAHFRPETGHSRPMRDIDFVHFKGAGRLVGASMHIANQDPAWWGEGDEKIFVDGEGFPSTFGTGTEDYFGYAWCDPNPFMRPYHAQPRCDGPGNFGHTNVNRFHILDSIPFQTSLQFDIELWHWAETKCSFDRVAYWYASPGAGLSGTVRQSDLALLETTPPKPVEGAIEGEALKILSHRGGELEQQGGFWSLSAGKQLWWKNMPSGSELVLSIPIERAGTYEVIGSFCRNRDYGRHRLTLAGKELGEFDFWSDGLKWERQSLGTFQLAAGSVELRVLALTPRSGALPGNMFGLDYLLIVPKN